MSNFIPMVSSSPPPLDDGAGFDDWGDDSEDDFGNFMGADNNVSQTTMESSKGGQWNDIHNGSSSHDTPQFADFGKFTENDETSNKIPQSGVESVSALNEKHTAVENGMSHETLPNSDSGMGLNSPSPELKTESDKPECLGIDLNSGNTINQSVTVDSGLSISDSSPVHKSEDSSQDETFENKSDDIPLEDDDEDDFDDFQSGSCISDFKHVNEEVSKTSQQGTSDSSPISDLKTRDAVDESASAADLGSSHEGNGDENSQTDSCKTPDETDHSNGDMSAVSQTGCDQSSEVDNEVKMFPEEELQASSEEISANVSNENPYSSTSVDEGKFGHVIGSDEPSCLTNLESIENSVDNDSCDRNESKDECERTSAVVEEGSEFNEREERGDSSSQGNGTEDTENDPPTVDLEENVCDNKLEKNNKSEVESEDFAEFSSAPTHAKVTSDVSETASASYISGSIVSESDDNVTNRTENADTDFGDFSEFDSKPNTLEFKVENENLCEDEQTEEKSKEDSQNATTEEKSAATSGNDNDDDDDDDDFDDFSSAPVSGNEDVKDSNESFVAFASSNDFAAFSEAPPSGETGGDNWAAFGDQVTDDQLVVDDDDNDDFDDFADFQDVPVSEETATIKPEDVAVSAFMVTFPVAIVTGSENGVMLMNDDLVAESPRTESLWTKLKKLDRASSVLQWTKARSNTNLFSCLRIDSRNIMTGLKNQSVPIYAANLTLGGVLEPTKGTSRNTHQTDSTLIDTTKEEEKPYVPEEVGPVQFDWSSAGLTNPLESNNKTLDLDLLVLAEAEMAVKNGVTESEVIYGQKPKLQPLENILANLKVSTIKRERQKERLAEETKRILQSLPDLSFMHSKVLMFPLRQQNDP